MKPTAYHQGEIKNPHENGLTHTDTKLFKGWKMAKTSSHKIVQNAESTEAVSHRHSYMEEHNLKKICLSRCDVMKLSRQHIPYDKTCGSTKAKLLTACHPNL